MNVLITGGTGLIGTALSRRLVAENHSVTILSRTPESHQAAPGTRLIGWDGRTPAGWGSLVNEVDAIVNLAGVNLGGGLWTAARKRQLTESRLNAGAAVVEAVRQAENKPAVLLQASAIGYYRASGDGIIDETNPAGKDFQGDLCQRWEYSTKPVEEMGVRRVITRSGVVFARGALILNMLMLPFRMFVGGPVGGGKQYISWIHVQDEIDGMLFLLQNPEARGAYNLMAPQPIQNSDMGRVISRTIHRPYWFPVPAFAIRLALGELSSVVLDSWRGVPARLMNAGFKFRYEDAESALKDLVNI